MGRFSKKLHVLVVPVMILFAVLEYKLSGMTTTFSVKKADLKRVASDVEIVVTGSSNAYYGINPQFFDAKGYNMANRAQSMYYDTEILQRRLDQMPKLKMVIITFIYLTFGTELEDIERWRVYFYDQYFSVSRPPDRASVYGPSYWIDPKRFFKVAIFGERTIGYVLNNFKENLADGSQPNGWFDGGQKPMDASLKIGPNGAHAHNDMVMVGQFPQNLSYVESLVKELKKRNITAVLLQLPFHPEYTHYVDKKKFEAMDSAIRNFATRLHLAYFNYTNDIRFVGRDYTDMPDHLNSTGARKISRIMNEDIVRPLFTLTGDQRSEFLQQNSSGQTNPDTKQIAKPWNDNAHTQLTNNVKTGFYETQNSEEDIYLEGWAFHELSKDHLNDSLYLVLESASNHRWIAPFYRFETPDVAERFDRKELLQAGFAIGLQKRDLKNGQYRAGLLFKNKRTNLNELHWIDYNFLINKPVLPIAINRPSPKNQTLTLSVSAIEYTQDNVIITAWAFPKNGLCSSCKSYFTLNLPPSFYAAEAINVPRPDVVSYLNNTSLLNSGLEVIISKKNLERNSYRLGVLLKDTLKQIAYFSESENLVQVGYEEFANPEEMSTIPQGTDSIRTFIDRIEDQEKFIQIKGWAFLNNVSTGHSESWLVLKSKNISYSIISTPILRSDIQNYFKLSYNLDLAGFSVKFMKSSLKTGEYQLCIMMLNKENNTRSLQCLDTTLKI